MTTLIALVLSAFSAPPDDDARAAVAVIMAQKPKVVENRPVEVRPCCGAPVDPVAIPQPEKPAVKPAPPVDDFDIYLAALARALKANVPLVVGVGCPPVVPTGYVGVRCDSMAGGDGWPDHVLWVCVPHNDDMKADQMPADSSVGAVRAKAEERLRLLNPPPVSYAPQRSYAPSYAPSFSSRSC